MAKCSGYACKACGEVQFTIIDDYVTTDNVTLAVIVCDSCGSFYRKPDKFYDENGRYE